MQLTYDIVERNTMGDPKMEFTYKKLCIYSYMFKLQSPSNYSPFDAIQLLKFFFYCSEQFLDPSILKLFSASAIFCFTSSTSTKRFPLRTFFILGNKSHLGQDQMKKKGGTRGLCHFWSKTAKHSAQFGQVHS